MIHLSAGSTRRLTLVLPLAFALVLGACSTTVDASLLGVPATLASPGAEPAAGAHFEVTRKAVFALWGLVPIRKPSAREVLAGQLVGGASVADVTIKVRSTWLDVLLTGLTLGLITPRSVTFEGTVVNP